MAQYDAIKKIQLQIEHLKEVVKRDVMPMYYGKEIHSTIPELICDIIREHESLKYAVQNEDKYEPLHKSIL